MESAASKAVLIALSIRHCGALDVGKKRLGNVRMPANSFADVPSAKRATTIVASTCGGLTNSPDCQYIGYNPDRHLGLVTSTWLHTYRQSASARLVHPATFTQNHRAVMDELLRVRKLEPDIVAAQNGEVIAWSLWEHTHETRSETLENGKRSLIMPRRILHYIWVAQPIRRCGFASSIARRMGLDRNTVMSHWSDAADRCLQSSRVRQLLCATNSPHVRFCPTLALSPDAFCAM